MPRRDLGERVGPDDEQHVGAGVGFLHLEDRQEGIGRPLAAKLEVEDLEARDAGDGGRAMARRCGAGDTGEVGLVRAGGPTGSGRGSGSPSASRTSTAIRRCPLWKGSNVPPKMAMLR